MRYLVTGANGFIGREVIKHLRGEVRCLTHKEFLTDHPKNIVHFKGNLSDRQSLDQAVEGVDVIIHLAAITRSKNKQDYFLINTLGTKNLLESAEKAHVKRFIHISTWALDPRGGAYSVSKLKAEEEVRKHKNWVIIRPADVYGDQGWLKTLVKFIEKSPLVPIIGDGKQLVSPVFVEDVAKAISASSLKKTLYKNYTLCGPELLKFDEMTKKISQFLKLKRRIIYVPRRPVILFAKLMSLAGFPNIEEMVRRQLSFKYYKSENNPKELSFNPINFEKGLTRVLSS